MSRDKKRVSRCIDGLKRSAANRAQAGMSLCARNASDDDREIVDSALVRGQIAKILVSRPFSASDRMKRFLHFAVESALAGRADELKEYVLGIEIFDRLAESFDPRIDPIVRVEARRLRSKLKEYYEGEGINDTIVIDLPLGRYIPRFRERAGTGRDSALAAGSGAPPPLPPPDGNILVLPFTNLSSDSVTEHFSDGLTEELIHVMTKGGFQVVAGNTGLKFDAEDDVLSIGRQLNVSGVLVGSVRRSVDRLRVMARLIETTSGYYVWSETYDRHIDDLLATQEEISRAIVARCRIHLAGASASETIVRRPSALESSSPYLTYRFN